MPRYGNPRQQKMKYLRSWVRRLIIAAENYATQVDAQRSGDEQSAADQSINGAGVPAGEAGEEAVGAYVESGGVTAESDGVHVMAAGLAVDPGRVTVQSYGVDLVAGEAGEEAGRTVMVSTRVTVESNGARAMPGRATLEDSGDPTPLTAFDKCQNTLKTNTPMIAEAEGAVGAQTIETNRKSPDDAATLAQYVFDVCELCEIPVLPKENSRKNILERKIHLIICRSDHQECNICLENVSSKYDTKRREFGLMENCNHAFCADCIYEWRRTGTVPLTVRKSCPVCRTPSKTVYVSPFWTDCPAIKNMIVINYWNSCFKKHCKFFKRGKGLCPFFGRCFYKHITEDGIQLMGGLSIFECGLPRYTKIMEWVSLYNSGVIDYPPTDIGIETEEPPAEN